MAILRLILPKYPLAPVQVDLFDYLTDPTGSQSITASQPQVVSDLLKLLP